mmetsp:Transcript_1278/g.4581  ORF Transcript_1278/g.4581 Transcript_1278/m.4581 type:complete len:201 (+) Transcript_1278:1060-1662(+)
MRPRRRPASSPPASITASTAWPAGVEAEYGREEGTPSLLCNRCFAAASDRELAVCRERIYDSDTVTVSVTLSTPVTPSVSVDVSIVVTLGFAVSVSVGESELRMKAARDSTVGCWKTAATGRRKPSCWRSLATKVIVSRESKPRPAKVSSAAQPRRLLPSSFEAVRRISPSTSRPAVASCPLAFLTAVPSWAGAPAAGQA